MSSLSVRDAAEPAVLQAFTRLARRVLSSDGHPAFNEETLVSLKDRVLRTVEQDGMLVAAVVTGGPEAEFAVDPGYRRNGLGATIVHQLLVETTGPVTAWAHGNHPAAQILAARFGFLPIRTLLQLRADVPAEPQHPLRQDIAITGFRPGADDHEWLALNAKAFAAHPE
ncbi:MAG: GNAT family N-acetyltransferase, partial [Microbacteriaceae bacterium]